MLRKNASLVLAAVAGAVLSVGARAQVIVQNFTIPTAPVSFTDFATFTKFDTTLGTLNSISLTLNTSITADVTVFNFSPTSQTFTQATASVPVRVIGPDGSTLTTTAVAGPVSGTLPPGLSISDYPGLVANNTNTSNIAPANFGNYIGFGGGTLQVEIDGLVGTYSGSTSSNLVGFGGSATAGGTFTLTYNYTKAQPTPEPGTAAFLAAGVLGSLGVVVRRRRSVKK